MKERDQLANTFNKYKEEFNNLCDVSFFKGKIDFVQDVLYYDIKLKHEEIINSIKELKTPNYLRLELDTWIDILEEDIALKKVSKDIIKKKLIPYLEEFTLDLKEIRSQIIDSGTYFTINKLLPKKTAENASILKRKEVAIFMHLLKENRVFNKDVSNELLGECMGALTSFTGKKVIADYGELKKHSLSITKDEKDTLKTILMKIHDNIDEQLDKI